MLSTSLKQAIDILRNGGVVGIPTDTVYGVAANALYEKAVDKVFDLKGREDTSPIPVLIGQVEDLYRYGREIPDEAIELARAFWPGQMTIVVPKADIIPSVVSGGLDTVGLRIADHPVPRELVSALGAPITATSANISGTDALSSAKSVLEQLGHSLDMVFDGGELPPSRPSTVVDASVSPPRILREGAVPRAAIEQVTGSA
ncbi:MAG: threonylcarbamoyl-AMP synthase [Dehalococcoidia bacterium]|nr:threonylcarbamoyl-AMP synthase [Dehalococcoidia bacterium]